MERMMQLKFDAKQGFQLQAIEAVVGFLESQPRVEADLRFASSRSSFAAVPHCLGLTEAELLADL